MDTSLRSSQPPILAPGLGNLPRDLGVNLDQYMIAGPSRSELEVVSNKTNFSSSDFIVLNLHGQWNNARSAIPILDGFAEKGITALSFGYRGQGESTKGKSPFFTLGHDCEDAAALITHITEKYPGRPIILAGHSYGGFVAQTLLSGGYFPEVKGLLLFNSISPAGSIKPNMKFTELAGTPAVPMYFSATGAISPDLAREVLFNVSGVQENWQSDAARRIPNIQAITGISSHDCETLRLRYPGRIMIIESDQDKLISWSERDYAKLGISSENQKVMPGDHMALYTQQTSRVVQESQDFIGRVQNSLA